MLELLVSLAVALASMFRSRRSQALEILALRQQLAIYKRRSKALRKDAPTPRPVQAPELGEVVAIPLVGGLHHRYERRAAQPHGATRVSGHGESPSATTVVRVGRWGVSASGAIPPPLVRDRCSRWLRRWPHRSGRAESLAGPSSATRIWRRTAAKNDVALVDGRWVFTNEDFEALAAELDDDDDDDELDGDDDDGLDEDDNGEDDPDDFDEPEKDQEDDDDEE